MLLLRTILVALDGAGRIRNAIDRVLSRLLGIPFALPILLAVPVGFLLQHHEPWRAWLGIPTPDVGLVPNAAAFLTYFLAFAIGFLIHRLKDGLNPLAKLCVFYITTALVVTFASLAMSDGPSGLPITDEHEKLVQAALYGLMVWLWTFGLIGAALRFIRKESPTVRYLADASYWLYIIHLPLLVALEAVVQKWALPAEIKLVLVVGASTAIMLASYHVLVRFTWLGQWINGKRMPRKRQAA
jgi:peptidoglycan/LPS O-acetylase OafA/YrhL